jgi:hypothetical protein
VTGSLEQEQVDTITSLLAGAAHWPVAWLAYGLATAWHEARLKPIEEIGKGRGKRYGVAGARSNGKAGPNYGGQIPFGRGLVQTTWVDNYEWLDRAAAEAGLTKPGDVLADFNLALRPDIAALGVRRVSVGGALARSAWGGFMRAATLIATEGRFEAFRDAASGQELNALFSAR